MVLPPGREKECFDEKERVCLDVERVCLDERHRESVLDGHATLIKKQQAAAAAWTPEPGPPPTPESWKGSPEVNLPAR